MSEIVARPLVGFRIWNVEDDELRTVTDLGDTATWAEGKARAACKGVPGLCENAEHCMCGLHIYSYPHWTWGYGVAGAVVAWGTIIEHQSGFRAEYARPIAFLEPTHYLGCDVEAVMEVYGQRIGCNCRTNTGIPARMAEKYEVPLLNEKEIKAYMSWFGDLPRLATAW